MAVVAVLAIGGIAFSMFRSGGSGSGSDGGSQTSSAVNPARLPPSLRNRLVLPATPQMPRPYTLEPTSFDPPEVRASYQAARDKPEVLEQMACYCGCFSSSGHRNNLDCFKDNHGLT
jgi:hypothetical protein